MANDRRPRLDAMLRAIEEGKYDEELGQITEAVQKRNEIRKEAVLKMVSEVFGEDHKIVPKGKATSQPAKDHLNVIKHSRPKWAPAADEMLEDQPDDPITAEKPPETPLTGDFESRSPKFGAIDAEMEVQDEGSES
jgi:hypothetical protein